MTCPDSCGRCPWCINALHAELTSLRSELAALRAPAERFDATTLCTALRHHPGEPRNVGMPSEAVAVFARRVDRYGTEALFPKRDYRKSIDNACRKAGVPRFTYRDLRTTFATIAAANADLASVRDAMGHTGVVTTNIYLRGQAQGVVDAGRAVQRVLLGKGEEE